MLIEKIERSLSCQCKVKMGAILLAGGQGSRLGIEGPKGRVPVTLVKKKSLFQLFFEKAQAALLREKAALPIAIMTSPLNHRETVEFLTHHHFFGFPQELVSFFQQSMRPLHDREDRPLDQMGPDGNGGIFRHFYQTGIWEKWRALGIEYVHVTPVDNVLANPFDAEIDFSGEELIIKSILRRTIDEKVGLIVQEPQGVRIVDYMELSPAMQTQKEDGSFFYPLVNTGIYCFTMAFIAKQREVELPLHRQVKKVKHGEEVRSVYKYETFILDHIPYAERVKIALYPREAIFAPLKNRAGEDGLESVQRALLARERTLFAAISGIRPDDKRIFELSPAFYYPTENLIDKWRGKELPDQPYIEP